MENIGSMVKTHIKRYFPDRKLGCLDLRRIVASHIFSLTTQGHLPKAEALLPLYAQLVNTSEKVLYEHYIRIRDSSLLHTLIRAVNRNVNLAQQDYDQRDTRTYTYFVLMFTYFDVYPYRASVTIPDS